MDDLLESYNFELPLERIAQTSAEPRDHARMLVYSRKSGEVQHKHIFDLPDFLRAGDLLVLNDTKVFKARLWARTQSGRKHEVLLIPKAPGVWTALCSKTKKLQRNEVIVFDVEREARIAHIDKTGLVTLEFNVSDDRVFALADEFGEVPLPPYIENQSTDLDTYQTTFAAERGSVAAPTAGRHFTPELFEKLRGMGVEIQFVTLHVGIGTFMPVRAENINDHAMHEEWVSISPEVSGAINTAKKEGRRVIAVGTTTTRALEGAALTYATAGGDASTGPLPAQGHQGAVNLFIKPGFQFRVIDSLITNFHLPKSTLLILLSALAGREKILELYQEAVQKEYRFYSLGDAMFIE